MGKGTPHKQTKISGNIEDLKIMINKSDLVDMHRALHLIDDCSIYFFFQVHKEHLPKLMTFCIPQQLLKCSKHTILYDHIEINLEISNQKVQSEEIPNV